MGSHKPTSLIHNELFSKISYNYTNKTSNVNDVLTKRRLTSEFVGRHGTLAFLEGHGPVLHAERECCTERNGEPCEAASDETSDAVGRLGRYTALPERLVNKH